ncbi:MAG: phosphotransferase [Bacilli bacterium]|nr:phosphotransferase [Bacilli bacterium]
MKKIKTNSYFVTICKTKNKTYIQRRKRKGLHAYPRILKLNEINKYLKDTNIKYPKLLRNCFKFTYEEYIESTKDINNISNNEIINYVVSLINELNKINIKNKKITWKNNSEFLKFNIDNLKNILIEKKPEKLNEYLTNLDNLYTELDNDRNLTFIHGDIHRKNIIINNENFYLIDWELSTYGDLAYELATHFILMDYTDEEKNILLSKLNNINIETLKKDINAYTKFELYRRIVTKEIKNN